MRRFNVNLVWCLTLIVCCFTIFWGIWHIPIIFDDIATLTNNPTIRDLSKLGTILALPKGIVLAWRPFANLTFALSYSLSGLDPWAHHGFALIIHALSGIVLFSVIKETFSTDVMKKWHVHATTVAGIVATLWLIHPVQSETVAYISQRTESLMGLFYLLTLYCFIRGTKSKNWGCFILSFTSMFLGILSKEVILSAPILIWCYDRTFISGSFKNAFRQHAKIYLLLALNWLPLSILSQGFATQAVGYTTKISWFDYGLTESKAVVTYLELMIWPNPLIFDRGPIFVRSIQEALPYLIILLGIMTYSVWALIKRPMIGFACAWFFIILAPTTSVIPIAEEPIAENRLYLPLIACITLVVVSLYHWIGTKRAILTCAVIAIVFALMSARRIQDYKTGFSIWSDTLKHAPNNPRAHNNLGLMWEKEKINPIEAIKEYEQAIKLDPHYAEAHNNLAILLSKIPGNEDKVIEHYKAALKAKPNFAEIHNNLALLLSHKKGFENEACVHYLMAIESKPFNADIYSNYSDLLGRMGRKTEAIQQCTKALQIEPNHLASLNNIAILLAETGHTTEAETYYRRLLKIDPRALLAWYNLANLLAESKLRETEALSCFKSALALNPDFAEAHYNVANLITQMHGSDNDAIEHFEAAVRINPSYVGAHNNLALLLASKPSRYTDAVSHYKSAIKLMPGYYGMHFNLAMLLLKIPGKSQEAKYELSETLKLNPQFTPAIQALKRLSP